MTKNKRAWSQPSIVYAFASEIKIPLSFFSRFTKHSVDMDSYELIKIVRKTNTFHVI